MFDTIVARNINNFYGHYRRITLVEKCYTILEMFCFLLYDPSTLLSEVVALFVVKYRVFDWDTALSFSTLVVNLLISTCPGASEPV